MKYFYIIFVFLYLSCNSNKKNTTTRKSKTEIFTDDNFTVIIHEKNKIYTTWPYPMKLDYKDSFKIKGDFEYNVYCNDSVIRILGKNYEKQFQKLKKKEKSREVDSIKIEKFKPMKSELQGRFYLLEYGGIIDFKKNVTNDLISGVKMKLEYDDKETLKDYLDFVDFEFIEKNKIENSDSTWKYIYTFYTKDKNLYLLSDNQNLYNVLLYFTLKYEFNFLTLENEFIYNYKNGIRFDVEVKPLE